MSDKPKRRWFQFSLSTAIVMMLAIGGFLLLNLRTTTSSEEIHFRSTNGPGKATIVWFNKGFPFVYDRQSPQHSSETLMLAGGPPPDFLQVLGNSRYTWIAFNVATAILLLLVILIFSEYLLRRREARKR